MLRSEGFVTLVPRRGFQVAEFTRQDVRDLFWAQGQLAGELAARAAKKATPQLLKHLEEINSATVAAAAAGDTERVADLGHSFHREINLAADSVRLALLLAGVVKHLPNQFYASLEAHVETTRLQHVEILDALKAHDSRRVRKIMEAHLVDSADHVIALLEKAGLWAESVPA
jgi:DNA-binding GntR family transcriptional regulator